MVAETLQNLALGFSVALAPSHLLYCLLGALIGTLIGVLPGLGVTATVAMLLPITFHLSAEAALIMIAGIYYGAQYGGSTTAILVNLPGESSSVVTCIDGNQMARKGRAGSALAVAALSSLFAGVVSTLLVAAFAPGLVEVALLFGPAEYFGLMVLGLVAAVALADGSLVKSLAMVVLGLLLGLVGTDVTSGLPRMTLGLLPLSEGINFVPLAVGPFAIPEVLRAIEEATTRDIVPARITRLWPTRDDVRRAAPATIRGTAVGSALGILPGGGAILGSFVAYAIERRISRRPEEFGHGAVEGVASPEAANNAGAQTSFVPLLTLGIPSNAVMALMAGAMVMKGIQPGPDVIRSQPSLFWGIIASMFVGNIMLVIINLPLIPVWVRLLSIPYKLLYPCILVFCLIGTYSVNNSVFDVALMSVFGLLGYAFSRWQCPPAPLVLAFVLGPLLEEYFRRALSLSRGQMTVFLETPLAAAFLIVAGVLLAIMAAPAMARGRAALKEA